MIEDIEGLSYHLRLEILWRTLIATDYEAVVIELDPLRHKEIFGSTQAHADGSITVIDGKQHWRGIPVKVVCNWLSAPARVKDYDVSNDPIEPSFCISLHAMKPNGRMIYFDDRDTHESYR